MSKRTKPNHNPRNPNICRTCKINTIGKNRIALGHSVCQACSKREETEWWANTAKVAKAKSELSHQINLSVSEKEKDEQHEH